MPADRLRRVWPRGAARAVGLTLLLGFGASAAPPSEDELQAARALGGAGVKLADAGDCRSAIEKLQKASEIYAAPSIVARLGECKIEVGRLVDGVADLQRVANEALPADAPKAFLDAQARSKKLLEATLPRLAELTLAVEAPAGAAVSVSIDDRELPPEAVGSMRRVDPGTHSISARAPGFLTATRSVTLAEGAHERVSLTLEPQTRPEATPGEPAAQPGVPGAAPATPKPRGRTLAWVAIGVGGAGVAVGSVLGVMAMGKKNDLDSACPGGHCPPERAGDLDSARGLALGATIGFGVGAAGLLLGTILLASGGSAPTAPSHGSSGLSLGPFLGAGSAGVEGSF